MFPVENFFHKHEKAPDLTMKSHCFKCLFNVNNNFIKNVDQNQMIQIFHLNLSNYESFELANL